MILIHYHNRRFSIENSHEEKDRDENNRVTKRKKKKEKEENLVPKSECSQEILHKKEEKRIPEVDRSRNVDPRSNISRRCCCAIALLSAPRNTRYTYVQRYTV